MKLLINAIYGITSIAAVVGGAYYGRNVPFAEQWPLYEALRTTAAIIFAVVGAWIAIKFPERGNVKTEAVEGTELASREGIGRYFAPVEHSIVVLCVVLVIGFVAPIAKRFEFVQHYSELFRGASYAVLVALTLFQLWTVIISLGPAADLKQDADTAAALAARRHNRKRLGTFGE